MSDDTCTPPAGTPDGTWHWLGFGAFGKRDKWWWSAATWRYFAYGSKCISPERMACRGGRYIGPVEPPQSFDGKDFAAVNAKLSANQQPLGADFEQVWNDNAAALYEGQDVPSPADALLRDLFGWVQQRCPHDNPPIFTRIRQHLGEK